MDDWKIDSMMFVQLDALWGHTLWIALHHFIINKWIDTLAGSGIPIQRLWMHSQFHGMARCAGGSPPTSSV